jgi:hypothetical protein
MPFECFRHGKFPFKAGTPHSKKQTETTIEKERILYLSGKWQMPDSEFKLEAVLFVGTNGSLKGSIKWQNIRDKNLPPAFCGNEFVSGQLDQFQVEIKGYRADAGLATDYYEIVLCGSDKSGLFGGKSRAYGNWNGRLEGSYLFSSGGQT